MFVSGELTFLFSFSAVLVDWLVEVQESFELNHETLYLAVKLIDHFLMRQKIPKSKFQLIGATAVFIASKFDVRNKGFFNVLASFLLTFILYF